MIVFGIVGGGAAGVSVLYQLVKNIIQKSLSDKAKIILFEKSPEIGPGLAYSKAAHDEFLLNVPASKMSPIPDLPDHFVKWLDNPQNLPKWRSFFPHLDLKKSEYLPRKLFGCYLHDLANVTKNEAKLAGIEVEFINSEVVNILTNSADLLEISLQGTPRTIKVNSIVLCTGHLPPSQPCYSQFNSLNQYFKTPWEIKSSDIPLEQNVLILGTRLTAIDAILARAYAIEQQKKETPGSIFGKMMAVSRSGMIPRVIGEVEQGYNRKVLTLEAIDVKTNYKTKKMTLAELKTMFEAEIKCASSEILGKSSETSLFDALNKPVSYNPKKLLKNEIFCVKNAVKRPWQTVLFSVYPTVPRIWEVLEDNDKKEFLEDYYSLWLSYLAAFPIDNAYKIYSLLKSGQLTIYRGLKDVTYDPQSGIFTAKLEDQNLHASYLINATGQGHDITQSNSPLLQNLLQNNYIQPHLLGGIEVDFITLRAISVDKVLPLFIVGDSTWGACMATADLAQLVTNQIPRLINSMLAPYRPSAISSRSNSPIHTRPASSFASNKTEGRQHDDSVDQSFRRQY